VIEQVQPDGTSKFVHPVVREGDPLIGTHGVDRGAHAGIPKGAESGGYGHGVAIPGTKSRDASGRFAKAS